MMTALTLVIEFLACLGYGALALRLLGLHRAFTPAMHVSFAFAVGLGVLGWLLFPMGILGLFQDAWLWSALLFGAVSTPLLRDSLRNWQAVPLDTWGWCLATLIAVVLFFDFAEALMPPTDADSLAYHFNAPRRFLETGGIFHILRPLDGAIPYLIQMSYIPVLSLGGEQAMTLWCMLSGWMATVLLYALSREHLSVNYALTVALLFLSAPAVVYGAGTGQIEIRMTLFALVAAWATARSLQTNRMAFTVLAGMMVGFYIGAKYIGLLFAVACGLIVLLRKNWFRHGTVFTLVGILVGAQWYAWNAVHTGDPFFPVFFSFFGHDDLVLWNREHHRYFQENFMEIDRPLARTLLNYFLYPFIVTLDAPAATEARKVGLGPFGLLLLPFALIGLWRFRQNVIRHPLAIYAAVAFLFYTLWFMSGPSQRVRHLVPIYPFLLLCFAVAANRWAKPVYLQRPLYAALVVTILLQMGGVTLFGVKYVRAMAQKEDHNTYLAKNLSSYGPIPWVNANLSAGDHLFHSERQLNYYLDVSNFFGSANTQAAVDLESRGKDPYVLLQQLRSIGATHILTPLTRWEIWRGGKDWSACFMPLQHVKAKRIGSRTLPSTSTNQVTFVLHQLLPKTCQAKAGIGKMVSPSTAAHR